MKLWGIVLFSLCIVEANASEMVKVRLFSTSQKLINVLVNSEITQTFQTSEIKNSIEIESKNLQINSHSVPPHVILFPAVNGSIDVIGVMDLEEYLKGVLPHEMPLSWPLEALKAQAVVARSFTKKQIVARKGNSYHLDSTVNDQMYRYNSTFNGKEKENLEKAIEETKGEVLEDQYGHPAKALYHADCGGQTEKASQVWGQKEVEFSVKDSKCPSNPYSNWEFKLSAEELRQKLKTEILPKELNITAETLSKRALQMEIIGLDKKSDKISSQEFRRLVGYTKLKSTKFQIHKISDGFLFRGSGFGHGVGLCQWGAKSWAKSGMNYREILKHYFPSYNLQKGN